MSYSIGINVHQRKRSFSGSPRKERSKLPRREDKACFPDLLALHCCTGIRRGRRTHMKHLRDHQGDELNKEYEKHSVHKNYGGTPVHGVEFLSGESRCY